MPNSTLSFCLLEANSHAQAWGQGSRTSLSSDPDSGGERGLATGKMGTAKPPYPPHPQPILLRSRAQWQGVGVGGRIQKLGNSWGLVS